MIRLTFPACQDKDPTLSDCKQKLGMGIINLTLSFGSAILFQQTATLDKEMVLKDQRKVIRMLVKPLELDIKVGSRNIHLGKR